MKYTLRKNEIIAFNNEGEKLELPGHMSQLINLANFNTKGTGPDTVGRMSELFPEFMASGEKITIENWRKWYLEKYPDAIEKATDKIMDHVRQLQQTVSMIDRETVTRWVEDLVINKTFSGMYAQKAILASLAKRKGTTYRLATPAEESIGIDGYVGDTAYSVKPESYKTKKMLPGEINAVMIYYTKTKDGLTIEIEE